MATLPNVDAMGRRPTPQSQRQISGYDGGAVGRALQGVGTVAGQVGGRMQEEEDVQAVFAARRQLDEWERANVYDPENGAVAKQGRDAFDLPKTLPGQFDKAAGVIGQGLTSARQREKFQQMVQSRREQIGAWADRHALQQRNVYDEGQYQADIDASANRTALIAATGDVATAKAEIATMAARTVGYLRGKGRSEEEISQAIRNNTSRVHTTVLSQMLQADDLTGAEKYLRENASGMNAEDMLRAQAVITKQVDARTGLVAATEVVNAAKPRVEPTDFGRLTSLVMNAESGGRRFGSDGKLLTSPKGAKGEMQVMDATNRDPGYGVKPAQDDSPEERARVGRDYLKAMLVEFKGDVPKALAAYNAGPGAVEEAVKKAGDGGDWLAALPAETQAYVTKIGKAYGDGGGAPAMPTLQEIHQQIRDRIGTDRPARLKIALDEGTRQYEDMVKAKKQREDEAEAAAMRWLEANGGRFSRMPANLRANVPPKAVDNLISFGQKIAKGDDITDPIVFQKMATDDAWLRGMSDAEFYAQSRKLSQADAQQMALRRGKLLTGEGGSKPSDLDTASVNAILNNRLQQMGMDPTPKDGSSDAQRIGAMRKVVWDAVLSAQLTAGKKFTDVDISNKVDELFAKSVSFQRDYLPVLDPRWYFSNDPTKQRLLTMKPGDIPGDVRDRIEADFKKQGIEPTDADILGVYMRLNKPTGATGSF